MVAGVMRVYHRNRSAILLIFEQTSSSPLFRMCCSVMPANTMQTLVKPIVLLKSRVLCIIL